MTWIVDESAKVKLWKYFVCILEVTLAPLNKIYERTMRAAIYTLASTTHACFSLQLIGFRLHACTLPCMYELIIGKICEMIVVLKPFTVTNYSLSHNKNEKKLCCSKKSSFVGYLVIFILPLCFLFSYIDVFWKI